METEREINLTESEVIAANLAALGVSEDTASEKSRPEQVLAALEHLIRERGRLVTNVELADHLGSSASSVGNVLRDLRTKGKVIQVTNRQTSKLAYIPKVV